MSKLRITKIAKTAEEGRSLEYRGVTLKIARANNTQFKAKFRQVTRPYKEEIDNDTIDPQLSEKLMIETFASTILVGWDNFVVDGETIPYSVENAIELLTNDEDCLEFVNKQSRDINNFLENEEKDLAEKS